MKIISDLKYLMYLLGDENEIVEAKKNDDGTWFIAVKSDKELLVKVGFSDRSAKLRHRRAAYRSHNPRAIMRSSCAGNTAEERSCHCSLSAAGGSRILGTEWFVVSQELFDELYNKGMGYFKPNHQPIHFFLFFSKNP